MSHKIKIESFLMTNTWAMAMKHGESILQQTVFVSSKGKENAAPKDFHTAL